MVFKESLNTHREFKIRRNILVFGLTNLSIPPTQIHKKKKSELAFALFRSEVLVLILSALMSAIFEAVGILNRFCEFSGKKSRSEQTYYTTFINSSWSIFGRNTRVVIFLDHVPPLTRSRKKGALKPYLLSYC